jgi:sulfite exporter TauE/SafE
MLWSALIFGLLGSFHCVGMCGPIAFLLPLDRKSQSKRITQLVSYHLGRLSTYGLIGFIFGLLGRSFNLFGIQQQISILIGVGMIVIILIPARIFNRYHLARPIYAAVAKVKNTMGSALKKKDPGTFFTIGFLNGLLPCGLVYMAVFGSLAMGDQLQGSLYMILFGMGTIPLMTTAIYLGNFLKGRAKKRIVTLIPVFIVIIGLLFILRGMGLGIKYISPSEMVTIEKVAAKHNCH